MTDYLLFYRLELLRRVFLIENHILAFFEADASKQILRIKTIIAVL